jgi:hypothetical protein
MLARDGNLKDAVAYGEKATAAGKASDTPPEEIARWEKQVAEWKSKA